MSRPWIKLYTEMLHDPKVGRLDGDKYKLFIELLLLAGEVDDAGRLMSTVNIAWELRYDERTLAKMLQYLNFQGLVHADDDFWYVTNWQKRQPAETVNDRVKRYRENKAAKASNDDVTLQKRYGNVLDIDKDIELEEEEDIKLSVDSEYAEFLKLWQESFPEKPQPIKTNKTLQGKLKTRLKSKHFRENWQSALNRGSASTFLNTGNWFIASWFLKNDDNYQKILDGAYDDRPKFNVQTEVKAPQYVPDERGRF